MEYEPKRAENTSSFANRKLKGHSYPFRGSPDISASLKLNRKTVVSPSPVVVEVAKDAPSIGMQVVCVQCIGLMRLLYKDKLFKDEEK